MQVHFRFSDRPLPNGIPVSGRACRTQQWIERDGVRREPVDTRAAPQDAAGAVHALGRDR